MTVEEFKAKYGGGPGAAPAAEAPPSGRSTGGSAPRQVKAARDAAATGASPADTSAVEPPPAPKDYIPPGPSTEGPQDGPPPVYGPGPELATPTRYSVGDFAQGAQRLGNYPAERYPGMSLPAMPDLPGLSRDQLMKALKAGTKVVTGDPRSE